MKSPRYVVLFFAVGGIVPKGLAACSDPWADDVVASSPGLSGSGLYNDPASALGEPTREFVDPITQSTLTASLAVAAYNVGPDGRKLLVSLAAGQFLIVRFDEPVEDDPRNPYGIDLLVFGNSFFIGSGLVEPNTDMNAHQLGGDWFGEPVVVAVSASGIGNPTTHPQEWYVYDEGPYADDLFPTNARRWDATQGAWGEWSDFTLPVDPSAEKATSAGRSAADWIELYGCSGGGAGFDLAPSGFSAISYVHMTSRGGEVDALADVTGVLGDADKDGDVDLADVSAMQNCFADDSAWGLCGCGRLDVDGDGVVALPDWPMVAGWMDATP